MRVLSCDLIDGEARVAGDQESPGHLQETWVDFAVYAFAGAVLIVAGVWLRSLVLNWIVGPAFIVALVVVATPLAHRFERRWTSRKAAR
jgi:hypothetical protein